MIGIVLAAGLGTANFIAIALLFRRMRNNLNRQLSNMRAERNSEWILRALQAAPEQRAAQAANGRGFEPPPTGPEPVRRKKHLGLFLGGGLAAAFAALSQTARQAARTHPVALGLAAAGVAAAATVVAVAPWQNDASRSPSSAPTATITTSPPEPASPTATPTNLAPTGSPSAPTGPPRATVSPPAPPAPAVPGSSPGVLVPIVRTTRPASSPGGTPTGRPAPQPPDRGGAGPTATITPPPSPSPSATPTATYAPAVRGVCLGVHLDPLLRVRLCPLGGG